jgi:hypothetical protein
MTAFDLTQILAIYGAVISTVSIVLALILGITELKRNTPRVKILKKEQTFIFADNLDSEPFIGIEIQNLGTVPITITGVGWMKKDGSRIQFLNQYLLSLPAELKPRKSITFYSACRRFSELKEIKELSHSFFQDELGEIWKRSISEKDKKDWSSRSGGYYLIEWDPTRHLWYPIQNTTPKNNSSP